MIKKNIAKMVHYPLQVYKIKKSGEKINYKLEDQDDFLGEYHALFNERAKKFLEKYHEVNCHPLGGIYTAGGEFYFYYSNKGIKISSLATIRDY